MVDMITKEQLKALKKEHPEAVVVGYVNTSADVKAEIDICCTSTNAVKIVESLKDTKEIIFVPDKYLAYYVSAKTNRRLIPWDGYCPTHVKILPEDILREREVHPKAKVIVHPECTPPVIQLADEVLSTEGMCKYAKASKASEVIVGTEIGLLYRLQKENSEKKFYPASRQAICPNMKLITLEKILWLLENMNHLPQAKRGEVKYEVKVPEDIRTKAKKAVDRMLEVS